MDASQAPESYGDTLLPPVPLGVTMGKMCQRLDSLRQPNGRQVSLPSEMVLGAVYAARPELRKNPDWLAQAAHSLRDTLYPFLSPKMKGGQKSLIAALKKYGSAKDPTTTVPRISRLFGELTSIAHHGTSSPRPFDVLLSEFESVLSDALGRQSDIHEDIDDLLAMDPTTV